MSGNLSHPVFHGFDELYESALSLYGSAGTVVTEQTQLQDRCHTIEQICGTANVSASYCAQIQSSLQERLSHLCSSHWQVPLDQYFR